MDDDHKERPILFSAAMVRATLGGGKTQTRRVMRPQPVAYEEAEAGDLVFGVGGEILKVRESRGFYARKADRLNAYPYHCPYGVPGDRLWVRETWRVGAWNHDTESIAVDYRADGCARREYLPLTDNEQFLRLWRESCNDALKAGLESTETGGFTWEPHEAPTRWRSPLYMPRWASRITLKLTEVRAERLQEISNHDADAEGTTMHHARCVR